MEIAQEEVDKFAFNTLHKGLATFEAQVAETKGKYCVGDTITLADLVLIPQLLRAYGMKVPMEEFPNIQAIESSLKDHPAFVDSHPKNYVPWFFLQN